MPLACFVRIYFVCHWLGDTLAGAVIGAIAALIVEVAGGEAGYRGIGLTSAASLLPTVLLVGVLARMRAKMKSKPRPAK